VLLTYPLKTSTYPSRDILVLSFGDGPKVADAVLTKRKNVLLGVAVADCVPVLIYDPIRRVCGAVHAGWRGTAKGILRRTLTVMEEHFYSDLSEVLIAIGPSIRWCCYTVGRDVLDAVQSSTGNGDYYETRNGKICLDLPTANGIQAVKSGVHKEHIWVSGDCTYCYPEKYFSYRYSRGPTGRQGGFVGMMVS
jgi:YfiH family protein